MIKINLGRHEDVAPEIMKFLEDKGLIISNLIGYERTEFGIQSCDETYAEQQKQKNDVKTGPSGKNDFHKEKRTVFSDTDDLSIPTKRRSVESMATLKPKPVTKYKKQD